MSASLIVIIPVALAALVGALCFVGCVFPTSGVPYPQGPYAGPIINDANLVAFWPLDDEPPSTTALATPTQFNGQYLAGPMGGSAPTLGQQGIVPGDVPHGASTANTCALFNGGLVSVGFAQALNPPNFTLECWVQPAPGGLQGVSAVLASVNVSAGAGFALFANAGNFWEIQIGIGGGTLFPVPATQMINANATNYLAVTYDGTTLTLFVGTVMDGVTTFNSFPGTPTGTYVAEDSTTATSLFIGMGRPDTGGALPFNGLIQDVAIYKTALSGQTIQGHFNNGTGL